MAVIQSENLSKVFRVTQKDPGLGGAIKALFRSGFVNKVAVDSITFSVERGEGGLIFIALNLITCVSAFWIMDSVPITRLVFDNHLFAQYPLTIYPKAIGIWLTWLIPYGFTSFYPASYLLGHDIGALAFLGPVIAVFLMVIVYRFWLFGLRHYTGTGS